MGFLGEVRQTELNPSDYAGYQVGERGRNRTYNLLIKSCRTSAGRTVTNTI